AHRKVTDGRVQVSAGRWAVASNCRYYGSNDARRRPPRPTGGRWTRSGQEVVLVKSARRQTYSCDGSSLWPTTRTPRKQRSSYQTSDQRPLWRVTPRQQTLSLGSVTGVVRRLLHQSDSMQAGRRHDVR